MIVGTREGETYGGSVGGTDDSGGSPLSLPAWGTRCLNCASAITGDYCSACGQRALPPDPTIRQLAGDAFSEFAGWDGKFVRSLELLICKPGELTRNFLIGKRVQFISPLRLYLACSFVFAAATALAPAPSLVVDRGRLSVSPAVQIQLDDAPSGAQHEAAVSPGMAALVVALDSGLTNLSPAKRAAAERQLRKAPGFLRPVFRAIAVDKNGFYGRVKDALPRALLVLIPGFAFSLALFYRHRHYPEHIYFAMHYQAFVFLVLALHPLAQLTGSASLAAIVRLVSIVGILTYEVMALRRVYGGSTGATIAKMAGMAAVCMTIFAATMVVVVYWSSRAYFGA